MTTATLSPAQRRNCVFVRNLGAPTKSYTKQVDDKSGNGGTVEALIVEGKPIFRSGTFSDSMGIEHTWETLHMNQMVDHASLLSSRGIFEDVPVRKGHPDWGGLFSDPVRNAMDELIGYMGNFRTEERVNPADGQTYTYLLADLEILQEDAIKNIKSGLWRNVSAEISTYVTNGNAEYWPVMYGVAYVDIPAVEGLKAQHSKAANQFSIILEEDMGPTPNNPNPPVPNEQGGSGDQNNNGGASNHSAPTPTPAPAAPAFSFSIGGQQTTDFSAVQAHITNIETENNSLKQFKRESVEAGRVAFVNGLVKANKISAADEDKWVEYAKKQDDEGFAQWKALMEGVPAMPVTNPQGAGFSQSHDQTQQTDAKTERIDVLKSIVSAHQMGNRMTTAQIMEQPSYKELLQLEPSFTL
ncbi:head maturation protease [Gordonia phage BirksAndSocks]|uniref:Capsid maturation protease n=3 Tax=Montyvirus TaxID=2733196 RepID=A0A411CRC4_9CAUD|nr:head maturation protease [Gordonia phage BirksAndSocks]YP_009853258.1 head maturation protease [Gordonia phage Jellybones]AUE22130.1 capsid maturation protease [Gordonia phage BirksAndSocks]QAY16401.1 capsid maturation protease [Gordonia phage Msay19]QGH76157.1 capsid maturation protease [Gordonia phage Jellybones]